MTKFKKLRPWQGHVTDKGCNVCGQFIDRKVFRWRCAEHCNWDLCKACYDRHWSNVIFKASKMEDPARRAELLQAVPEDRRPKDDWPQPCRTNMPPLMATVPAEHAESSEPETLLGTVASALKLVAFWVVAALVVARASTTLLSGTEPKFPNPWLLAGVSHVGALLVCKVVVRLTGYQNAEDQEAVDTTSAMVLGLMFGIESGLYTSIFVSQAMGARDESTLLAPAVMSTAALLAGIEPPSRQLAIIAAAASLGGALVPPGAWDWPAVQGALPWLILAGVVTVFRWVFALNVLPRQGGLPPLWFFAGQIMWPSAGVCFELAFLTDWSCYRQLLHLADPAAAVGLVAVLAVACSARLVMELRLAHLVPLTVLGLIAPLPNIAELCRAALTTPGGAPSLVNCAGLVLYAGAAYMYYRHRQDVLANQPAAAPPGYDRLEAGKAGSLPAMRSGPPMMTGQSQMPPPSMSVPDPRRLQHAMDAQSRHSGHSGHSGRTR